MIARNETEDGRLDRNVWANLSAPLPSGAISWRQDGKPAQRDGKFFARFVAYIDAHTVRERLDRVVPGEWDVSLEALPLLAAGGEVVTEPYAMKARLQILGVVRECVGQGPDWKQASTDAFKRAAVRFGVGHELYAYEQNWVQVDGDGRFAKPLEDPQTAYARRQGGATNGAAPRVAAPTAPARVADTVPASGPGENAVTGSGPAGEPACPKCGGKMWDNRATKRNPRQPDYKCRDRSCDGVVWPPKGGRSAEPQRSMNGAAADNMDMLDDEEGLPY